MFTILFIVHIAIHWFYLSFWQFFHCFLDTIISKKYRGHFVVIFIVKTFVFPWKVLQLNIIQMTFIFVLEIGIQHQMLWIFTKSKFLFRECYNLWVISSQFHVSLDFIPYATNIYSTHVPSFKFDSLLWSQRFIYYFHLEDFCLKYEWINFLN